MTKMKLMVISVIRSLLVYGMRGLKTSCKLNKLHLQERLIDYVNMLNIQEINR